MLTYVPRSSYYSWIKHKKRRMLFSLIAHPVSWLLLLAWRNQVLASQFLSDVCVSWITDFGVFPASYWWGICSFALSLGSGRLSGDPLNCMPSPNQCSHSLGWRWALNPVWYRNGDLQSPSDKTWEESHRWQKLNSVIARLFQTNSLQPRQGRGLHRISRKNGLCPGFLKTGASHCQAKDGGKITLPLKTAEEIEELFLFQQTSHISSPPSAGRKSG